MSDPVRWTSHAVFDWTPILTFTRRRLAVLDWFEENVDVKAFTDDPDHAGIAVENAYQRLRFDRESLSLTLADPAASVEPLTAPLRGLWEILEPEKVTLEYYFGSWSCPVEADYEAACARFGSRVVGADLGKAGVAYDAAALVDIVTPAGLYKIEFGVVSNTELVERLKLPGMGLLHTTPEARPEVMPDAATLPPVSVFFDVAGRFNLRQRSADKVALQLERVESEVSRLAAEIGSAL